MHPQELIVGPWLPSGWLFAGWPGAARVALTGVLAYLAVLVMLRASGKRTLSKMNAFDLVVTVALGSTLASTLTSKDLALMEGLTALATLIGVQFVVAWSASRSGVVNRLVKGEPALIAYRGRIQHETLRRERVASLEGIPGVAP